MKTCLVILDGWGFNKTKSEYDAINNSTCYNMRRLSKIYPSFLIHASGVYVGLPANKMGNSEVGHLTIGSGRIIKQYSTIIDDSIKDGTIVNVFKPVLDLNTKVIHLVIMISDGGIHSHINHLFGVLEVLKGKFSAIYINCITDGRDTAPYVAMNFINQILDYCKINKNCRISTIGGRFYGMDRDKNVNRIEEYFDVLT
ncbi:2,3-bisphosphoglycerate-independent phosphoglycerate mutase [Nosema bombycis CQ1]|uniref:phosphoglycerate mutase (2,3-diphosphoglycerate-independent) n=1 Tax=Nosema bombycis (strain CQ1 / CVCC 102059) TaxID=578461 RepID=R0KPU2_NOSB1|nr:2,3-bisphosphoglycerate-independent phosphoglycerate mutase [Nosema bombycis CQ1]|eukprot:EOB12731.1 2,3-bisphosphoglycerate-independent phosphoglycerate mutase [Nosema bombycis CQ1]